MSDLILKGSKSGLPKIDKGVGEYFFEQTERHGDKIFQIDGDTGKTETYSVVKQRSTRVAIHLQQMNIKPKDVVMLCCLNNIDNIIPAFAAMYLGAYVASVDPKQTVADVTHSINLVEPKVIFVEEHSLLLVEKSMEDARVKPKIIVIGASSKYPNMYDMEQENLEEKSFRPIKQSGTDIAAILFSSGTTSAPKGILLSNQFFLNWRLVEHEHLKPSVLLHFSSLYWVSAWCLTGITIATGTAKVVAPSISAEKFLEYVEKYAISHVFTSNTFTYGITGLPEETIKKYNTSSLYNMSIGGSTMDPQQILRLRKYLPHTYVNLTYGSTEANYMVGFDYKSRKAYDEKILSSGTVFPETELKVVDMESGKLLGPNQEGEIRIRHPYVLSGYYNFHKTDAFDEEGFLKPGDIGYYDDDHYIYVTDRMSEMFKYKTNQISPSELEVYLLGHPSVAEAVVFGLPHFVDRFHPSACVVLKKEAMVTEEEMLQYFNSRVADCKKLRGGLMIIESLPKTPTGKIKRRVVRDMFIKSKKDNGLLEK